MTVSGNIKREAPSGSLSNGVVNMVLGLCASVKHSGIPEGIKTILSGYAQVYFSKHWLPGLFFCLSTFVLPAIGVAGLSGMLLSTLFANMLGFSREKDDRTFFACNGLLTALALALTYSLNLPCVVMLVLSMFLCVLIASALRTLFEKYLFIPVLSLPFIITTWIVTAAGRKFTGLIYTTRPFEIEVLNGVFPEVMEFMFRSFGAAFFQLSVPSGLLVAIGLLVSSRHAFIVSSLALFVASFFHMASGGSMADLNGQWIGFNFALTAIAVGGMFVVPGIGSYALALISALISSVVAAGSLMLLEPLGLPVLATPFVFTTIIILYPLRSRISPRCLQSVTTPKESPEANLKHHKNPRARFVSDDTPAFNLPVSGEWTITQGFDGDETHKDLWAHALDFEVTDELGNTFKNSGSQLTDYYAWNMPVFAPGDGVISRVVNTVDDNRVGQVNTRSNWGNTVIIWHYGTVYSSLSHLAKESVCVKEGDTVKKGKVIGKVGNSGRSPFPHLHFQIQLSPEPGSHTIPFNLLNYSIKSRTAPDYRVYGIPKKGQVIESVQSDPALIDSVAFPIGGKWVFDVASKGKSWKETWVSEIDFIGNRFLRCMETQATLHFYVNTQVILFLDYKGPSNTALEWLFLGAPCIPFTRQGIQHMEPLPAEKVLNPVQRLVFDCVEPVCELASLNASSVFTPSGTEVLSLNTRLSLKQRLAPKHASAWDVQIRFERHRGLTSLQTVSSSGDIVIIMWQRGVA